VIGLVTHVASEKEVKNKGWYYNADEWKFGCVDRQAYRTANLHKLSLFWKCGMTLTILW